MSETTQNILIVVDLVVTGLLLLGMLPWKRP